MEKQWTVQDADDLASRLDDCFVYLMNEGLFIEVGAIILTTLEMHLVDLEPSQRRCFCNILMKKIRDIGDDMYEDIQDYHQKFFGGD